MAATESLLAIDLGAESGRAVRGAFDGTRLQLEEVHRFANTPVQVGETLYWDILGIFANIQAAIAAAKAAGPVRSVGVDTWGVDFGLLDRRGRLIGNPVHYRDARTAGLMERAFSVVPKEEVFDATGNMFLELNTLYQLLSLHLAGDPSLHIADRMLNTPDLLHYWLSGVMANELSIASTTQCLATDRAHWANEMLDRLGIPTGIFGDVVLPGTCLGALRGDETTLVVTPASHDTGSAVMAVPGQGDDVAWISSGTWSVVGVTTPAPVVSRRVMEMNFTNEATWARLNRFSRNVMGLWLIQECRREWQRQGQEMSYADLVEMAEKAPPLRSIIDPDEDRFFRPGRMSQHIRDFCAETGQPAPETPGEFARCIYESLALAYRRCFDWIEELTGRSLRRIHIVGGGSQNSLLCRFTADATGRQVIAGPVEATAIGNLLAQAMAHGWIGSLEDCTKVVEASFPTTEYTPAAGGAWEEAYERYKGLG